MKEERKCGYRNCHEDIKDMRTNAKFCCRNCKDMERTYLKRKAKFIDECKNRELMLVNIIKLESHER